MPITDQILSQNVPMHVRSNHALEHATLHVLQERGVNVPMGGISDAGGFLDLWRGGYRNHTGSGAGSVGTPDCG